MTSYQSFDDLKSKTCLSLPGTQKQNGYKKLNSSVPSQKHMTVRDLKRLRLKKEAMSKRLHGHGQADNLLRIPEDDEALFHENPFRNSVQNVYKDLVIEDIYKRYRNKDDDMVANSFVFEDSDSNGTDGSPDTVETANSSIAEHEQELIVTAIHSLSPRRGSGPVDLDDSLDYSDEENTDDSVATPKGLIDMDMLQEDNNEKFEKILEDHEDQRTKIFHAAETDYNYDSQNEVHIHPGDQDGIDDSTSVHTYGSLDTFGFVNENRKHVVDTSPVTTAVVAPVIDIDPPLSSMPCLPTTTTANVQKNQRIPDALQNMANPKSIDPFGFPIDESAAALLATITQCPSHNDAQFTARHYSQEQEDKKKNMQDVKDEKEKKSIERKISSPPIEIQSSQLTDKQRLALVKKARKLRAQRLRASTNTNDELENNNIIKPNREFPLPGEEKSSSIDPEHPGHSGEVIKVRNKCQSVVSEITNLSEKLSRDATKPKPKATKWDDMSSIGASVADQERREAAFAAATSGGCEGTNSKKSWGHSARNQQLDYDASVKTPPTYNGKSKCDDGVSSIGLLGVEAINHDKKPKQLKIKSYYKNQAECPIVEAPFQPVYFTSDEDSSSNEKADHLNIEDIFRKRVCGGKNYDSEGDSSSEKVEHLNIEDIFRKRVCGGKNYDSEGDSSSEATPTFSTLWGEGPSHTKKQASKKSLNSSAPNLELNPTLETVLVEFSDSYSTSSAEEDRMDPEMQAVSPKAKNEVSTSFTSHSTSEDAKKMLEPVNKKSNHCWAVATFLMVLIVLVVANIAVFVHFRI